MTQDVFRIKDFHLTNRLFVGTGKYQTYELMQKSLEASAGLSVLDRRGLHVVQELGLADAPRDGYHRRHEHEREPSDHARPPGVGALLERVGPDAVVTAAYTVGDVPALEAELSEAMARIQANEFRPTPDEFVCSDCPALDLVCAGPKLRG